MDAFKSGKRVYVEDLKPGQVRVCGWVQEIRHLGRVSFIKIRDRSGIGQVVVKDDKLKQKIKDVGREWVLCVEGKAVRSGQAHRGIEIVPESIDILNQASEQLPLDVRGNINAGLDTRLNARAVDLRVDRNNAIFRLRDLVFRAVREWFNEEGYTEVHTPRLIKAGAEGGATLFKVGYFGGEAYLSQSPQLYKEILTGDFEKVYEIGPFFRAEPSDTVRHTAEFTGIDMEAAFMDDQDVMGELESLFWHVVQYLKNEGKEGLEILGRKLDFPKPPYERMSYDRALEILKKAGHTMEWGQDIGSDAERIIGDKIGKPFFIQRFPAESKPFYIMPDTENPKISRGFDFDAGGMELASGGMRIHARGELEESLKRHGLEPKNFEEHLKNFEWGMPPHAGWGLGADRLVMVLLGLDNIREAILFPRDLHRLTP